MWFHMSFFLGGVFVEFLLFVEKNIVYSWYDLGITVVGFKVARAEIIS